MLPYCVAALVLAITSASIIPSKENIFSPNLGLSRDAKKALGYPEDAYLNFTELATKYGYSTEEHTAVTEDGYVVKLFRISYSELGKGPLGTPVLLVPGLSDSPEIWILPGPGRGLGYVLAEAGYDVWCANYRGSRYTRSHVSLDPNTDVKFWRFSTDEISQFDIPLLINYVLKNRKVETLAYVGHSLGCRVFYQMEAYRPDMFKKVSVMISLGPAPWATHLHNPTFRAVATATPEIEVILNTVGIQEIFGSHSLLANIFTQVLCAPVDQFNRSLNEEFCTLMLSQLFGHDPDQLNKETIPIIFGHNFNTVSKQIIAQLGQGVHTPKFQRYDRGLKGNIKAYGKPTPPEYNPSLVTTPIAIFSGRNDWLASLKDAETLISKLPNFLEHYIVPRKKWNHIDHLYAKEAPELIGKKMISIISKHEVSEIKE